MNNSRNGQMKRRFGFLSLPSAGGRWRPNSALISQVNAKLSELGVISQTT